MNFQEFYAEVDRLLAESAICISCDVWRFPGELPTITWKVWDGNQSHEGSTMGAALKQLRASSFHVAPSIPADLPGQE